MIRREFLTSVSMLAAASVREIPFLYANESEYKPLLPIVDTHQHLVDVERFGKEWSHPPVAGNYGIEDYKKVIKGLNVVKAVYMEVAVPPYKRFDEALYAMELCKQKGSPTVGAVISADLYMDDFRGYMSKFKHSTCIKGIRAGFKSRESMADSRILDNIRFLGDMDMRFDFIVPPTWFPDMVKLLRACPGTQFQADHCSNADPKAFFEQDKLHGKPDHSRDEWINGVTAMASESNVVCKISGLVSRLPGYPVTAENLAPAVNHCIDIFGADRVMFASDWPWCLKGATFSGWVNLLKEVVKGRSIEDQGKLFHDNAVRHYKI